MRGDGELHWMLATGVMLVTLAIMICVMVFALPVFEGHRTELFWFVATPTAVIGGLLVLYRIGANRPK
jgi:succinate dehydrogenase hydrophobic anchor subunit